MAPVSFAEAAHVATESVAPAASTEQLLIMLLLVLPMAGFVLTAVLGRRMARPWLIAVPAVVVVWAIATYLAFQALVQHAFGNEAIGFTAYRVDPGRRFQDPLQPVPGQPDGRDVAGGHDHRHARPRLFHRLHGARRQPLALLCISQPVHVQHAAAGPGRELPAGVRGLGAGRPIQLPAHRLLVLQAQRGARQQEGLPDQPGR